MENKITSQVNYSVPVHREYVQLVNDTRQWLVFQRTTLLVCMGYICLTLWAAEGNFLAALVLGLCAIVGLSTWRNIREEKNGGVQYQQMVQQNQGKAPRSLVTLSREGIRYENLDTRMHKELPLNCVVQILESENLLILMTNMKLGVTLDKRTLQGADRDGTIAWIRENCPRCAKRKVQTGTLGHLLWKLGLLGVGVTSAVALLCLARIL